MSIRLPCPCGKVVVARAEAAGKTVRCPACGHSQQVPALGKAEGGSKTSPVDGNSRIDEPAVAVSGQAAASVWPKVALGAGAGFILVGLVVVVLALSSGGRNDTPVEPAEPIALLKQLDQQQPPVKDKEPAAQQPVGQQPVGQQPVGQQPVGQQPGGTNQRDPDKDRREPKKDDAATTPKPETPEKPLPPKNDEQRVVRKFIDDKNSAIPVQILVVEETKIPYKVRRLKIPENAPRQLKLAVSPSGSDNIAEVLDRLGMRFDNNVVPDGPNFPDRLSGYDVLFMNCGGGTMGRNVREFVEKGGTLYASDLQFGSLVGIFPEVRSEQMTGGGIPQKLIAKVVDAGLREFLGVSDIELNFNAPGWMPAMVNRDKVTVFLEGKPTLNGFFNLPALPNPKFGGPVAPFNPKQPPSKQPKVAPKKPGVPPKDGVNNGGFLGLSGKGPAMPVDPTSGRPPVPLLVKFRCGEGTVIFTSFHNNAQANNLEKKLLNYLVFSALTAKAESKMTEIMLGVGFAPSNLKTLEVSPDKGPPPQVYLHQSGGFQIALGFENLGAKLRLTLTPPKGEKIEHEESGTFLLEVPNAPPGEWQYTVTPVAVPFNNFPVVLAVGKGKE